eukprot:m.179946 g.179946  ORF g.179946 m.179946 type:complete len:55 (+) comp14651_c2_seq1:1873-2037(+)
MWMCDGVNLWCEVFPILLIALSSTTLVLVAVVGKASEWYGMLQSEQSSVVVHRC